MSTSAFGRLALASIVAVMAVAGCRQGAGAPSLATRGPFGDAARTLGPGTSVPGSPEPAASSRPPGEEATPFSGDTEAAFHSRTLPAMPLEGRPGRAVCPVPPAPGEGEPFPEEPAPPGGGTVTGVVRDAAGTPLRGHVEVTFMDWVTAYYTDADGRYRMGLRAGEWRLTATAECFAPETRSVTVRKGAEATLDFTLSPEPAPYGMVEGTIRYADGRTVESPWMDITTPPPPGQPIPSETADIKVWVDGERFHTQSRLPGVHRLWVTDRHSHHAFDVTVVAGRATEVEIVLPVP